MNYYIVVEGKCGERIVYPYWLKYINEDLKQVEYLSELTTDTYYLISGDGYPSYLKIVDRAVEDVINNEIIDKLVIIIDSEDYTEQEIKNTIKEIINDRIPNERYKIILQVPSLEGWALGNNIVCKRNPQCPVLRRYLRIFDVRTNDPELLPPLVDEELNRAQFAFKYLKKMLKDRYSHLHYSKSNPATIADNKYFQRLIQRNNESGHIKSFEKFIKEFKIRDKRIQP